MDVLYQCKLIIYTDIQYESTISPTELNPGVEWMEARVEPTTLRVSQFLTN